MQSSNRTRDKDVHRNCYIFLYLLFVAVFAVRLFLYGFFPIKDYDNSIATMDNVPDFIEHTKFKKDELYKPMVKRVVIMVIDALRWDFVAGPIGKTAMPNIRNLIANNSACILQAKVNPPTVTMPRIKAMTTGTVPSFVDVALSFGAKSLAGDSVLLQAKNHGHKLIFYGDDTWLKLFPEMFFRHDGTTSFYVTDYTEVDNNVTRHIDEELEKDDWSIMVLHYLGLDHIGHVGGPLSPLIKPKLKEMDDIVGKIHAKLTNWVKRDIPSLLIVCGDHGMKDSGGHGGSTPQETLVPLVAIGTSCPSKDNQPNQIAQMDISSTLAVMLGVPIPSSNIGSIALDLLRDIPDYQKLFVLHYNSKQVFSHYRKLADYESRRAYQKYVKAMELHTTWLNSVDQTNHTVDEIVLAYSSALKSMKEVLTNSMIKYDLHIMTIAIMFMYHVLYIAVNTESETQVTFRKILQLFALNIIVWFLINYMWENDSKTILFSNDTNSVLLKVLITVTLFVNCVLCAKLKCTADTIHKLAQGGFTTWVLSLGSLAHAISLSSSSFVEEEHQTWYFFWVTLFVLLLYDNAKSLIAHLPSCRDGQFCPQVQVSVRLLLLLLGHRILRKLNSTGDKYAHLPDIADWLQQQEYNIGMTLVLVGALSFLVWVGYACEEEKYKRTSLMLYIAIAVSIYLRHMATEAVVRVPFYPASRGIYEVRVFWILLVVFLAIGAQRLFRAVKYNRTNFLTLLLSLVVQFWVMVSAMLHRPYNVGLLPVQLTLSSLIHVMLRTHRNQNANSHVHSWLGNVFYYYQGNSHSLASIDVAAGYVGLETYRPFVTGLFLVVNTYSAPILAYLTLAYGIASTKPESMCKVMLPVNRNQATWRLVPMAVYTIIVSIQRYHLFVWTVFSPKLLYEAMHCAVMYTIMFIMQIIFILHDKINHFPR